MASRPNVLFVVLDAVRRDRVGAYGYERATTPTFDAVADVATRYEDPVAQAPWSIPSQASLLTGAYPTDHGATTIRPILRHRPTLPSALSDAGYSTVAVSPNEFVRPATGFGRGFDAFYTPGPVTVPDPVADLLAGPVNTITNTAWLRRPVERAFNRLREVGDPPTVTGLEGPGHADTLSMVERALADVSEPYFAYVTLMDVHLPRSPAREHAKRFVDDELRDLPVVANERAHVFSERDLDPRERRKLGQLYDADLRTMDDRLAGLLDLVGDLEDTLVVLVSDHGEHLGEFGLIGHQHSVFDSVVSVPLVVKYPGQTEGRTVAGQVETRRVYHTVLDEAGVAAYPDLTLRNGVDDQTAYGEFYTPMLDVGRLLWDGEVAYDPDLLGERLWFVREDGHKLVGHAGEEWLFETPETRESVVENPPDVPVRDRLTDAVPVAD